MSKRIAVKRPHRKNATTASVKRTMRKEQNSEEQSWSTMYSTTEHWASEIEFFTDELDFLSRLVSEHYMSFIGEHTIERTRGLASLISETVKKNDALGRDVESHLKHLASLIEEPFSHNAQEIKVEHEKLVSRISDFEKELRSVKKETFELSKVVIRSEKEKRLLKP